MQHLQSADSDALPPGLRKEEPPPAKCHYGTLPGGWISSQGRALLPWHADDSLNMTFPVWQPYCDKCQLKPLLAPYLEVSQLPDSAIAQAALDLLKQSKRWSKPAVAPSVLCQSAAHHDVGAHCHLCKVRSATPYNVSSWPAAA